MYLIDVQVALRSALTSNFKEKKRVGAIPEYGDSEFEVASAILVLDRPGIECGHLYIFTTYLSNISHVEQVSHSIQRQR
jgi:hypothetical protein